MPLNINDGALEFDAIVNLAQFEGQLNRMEAGLRSLTDTANRQAASVDSFANKVQTAIGGYLTFQAGKELVSNLIQVRGEFQQLEVAFRTMLRSKEKADQLMAEIVQLAATTPFTLQDVGGGAKQLLAYGFALEEIIPTLKQLGDVSAGVGAPLNDIIYLFGTLKTQGKVLNKDILQFTSRGIPIIAELAKVMGSTEAEVSELVNAGKIGFPEVKKAFDNLTNSGGLFFNLMQGQSKTLTGQLSNLQDAFSRMLNDIGKSNEGILSGAITGLTDVINNYEKFLEILEILVVSYGVYRAALAITAVAQRTSAAATALMNVQTQAAVGFTVGQTVATTNLTRAQALATASARGLGTALMAIAPLAVITAIVALVDVIATMAKGAQHAKEAAELMASAQREISTSFQAEEQNTRRLIDVMQGKNVADSERLAAYNKLKEVAPSIIGSLTVEQAKTANLTAAVDDYTMALKKRMDEEVRGQALRDALKQEQDAYEKAKGKFDKPDGGFLDVLNPFSESTAQEGQNERDVRLYKEAVQARIKLTEEFNNSIKGTTDALQKEKNMLEAERNAMKGDEALRASLRYKELEERINFLTGAIKQASDAFKNMGAAAVAAANKALLGVSAAVGVDIDETGFNKAKIRAAQSLTKLGEIRKGIEEQYQKETDEAKRKQLAADLRYADQRAKLLDPYKSYGATAKAATKANNAAFAAGEARANKLKSLFEKVADMENEARQSGLKKEESVIDQIKVRYEELRKLATDLKASQAILDRINAAEKLQIDNTKQKQGVEDYKKMIDDQREVFDQFEEYKVELGTQRARQLTKNQTGEFDSYVDYLKNELNKLKDDTSKGGEFKKDFLTTKIKEAEIDADDRATQAKAANLTRLLDLTQSAALQRVAIEEKYARDVEALGADSANMSVAEYTERFNALARLRDDALARIKVDAFTEGEIYRKLNEDITTFTREELGKRLAYFKALDPSKLPPIVAEQVRAAIEGLEGLIAGISDSSAKSEALTRNMAKAADIFNNLSSAASNFDKGLADILGTTASLITGLLKAKKAFEGFEAARKAQKADKGGGAEGLLGTIGAATGVIAAVGAVVGIVAGIFKKAKEKRQEAARQEAQDRLNAYKGELEITALYRERAREQVKLNKLKLEGIAAEAALLKKQKEQVDSEAKRVIADLQKEVKGLSASRSQILGGGALANLPTLDYAQLEELFKKDKLTAKGKELFEILEKLKKEGADLKGIMDQLDQERKEVFTGTTADAITDEIVSGFAAGKRSAADFADTFEALMKKAVINALKYQVLEKPLKEFYESFAKAAESDGVLSEAEIAELKTNFDAIMNNAGKRFDELKKITKVDFGDSLGNTMTGAIKGITAQQADLLAGQFGGLRLTGVEQLNVARQSLAILNNIQNNTASTVSRLDGVISKMTYYFETVGVKLR